MKKILVEGHRGYCAKYPENTLISYEAALRLGVDAFEFDVWLTKDKVPVLMHDGNALRTCGVDAHVRDMTLAEVKELDACYEAKFGDRYKGMGVRVCVIFGFAISGYLLLKEVASRLISVPLKIRIHPAS